MACGSLERPLALDLFLDLFDSPGHFLQQNRSRGLVNDTRLRDADRMATVGINIRGYDPGGRDKNSREKEY
jgi:hypothetical protein